MKITEKNLRRFIQEQVNLDSMAGDAAWNADEWMPNDPGYQEEFQGMIPDEQAYEIENNIERWFENEGIDVSGIDLGELIRLIRIKMG
jgi:hypothetical protein